MITVFVSWMVSSQWCGWRGFGRGDGLFDCGVDGYPHRVRGRHGEQQPVPQPSGTAPAPLQLAAHPESTAAACRHETGFFASFPVENPSVPTKAATNRHRIPVAATSPADRPDPLHAADETRRTPTPQTASGSPSSPSNPSASYSDRATTLVALLDSGANLSQATNRPTSSRRTLDHTSPVRRR